MKRGLLLLGAILLLANGASAQVASGSSLLLGLPMPRFEPADQPAVPRMGMPIPNAAAASDPAEPQGVYGVFQTYNWEFYAGYTFVRFYELPGTTRNLNGFDFSVQYYFKGNWAFDGEFTSGFASQSGASDRLVAGLGGARYRLASSRGVELWIHGLAGAAHFLPQTPFGSENAFAYAVGGGADLTPRRRRLGYRLQVDMLGTRFFGTHQYNPEVSVGVVYKL
jgi:hypothetical protein